MHIVNAQCFKQSHNQRFTDITVLISLTMRHPGEDTSAAQILTFLIHLFRYYKSVNCIIGVPSLKESYCSRIE